MAALPSWQAVFELGEALRRILAASKDDGDLPRYVRNRARDPKWQGPYYYFNKNWRQDLVLVLEQIRLNVAANAPLSPAFAAATSDFLTLEKGWSPQHVGRLLKLAALALLTGLSLLAALFTVAENGYDSLPELLRPGFFGAWLIVTARHQHYKTAAVFTALQRRIESGHSLSEAMARLPKFFPHDLVSLVRVAEKTGNLQEVLAGFSDDTIAQWTAKKDLDRVLRYIGIGLLIQCGICTFMVVKVLPVFEDILQELDTLRYESA